jgi:hypothetical protein
MRDRIGISSVGVKVVLVQHYFLVALLFQTRAISRNGNI